VVPDVAAPPSESETELEALDTVVEIAAAGEVGISELTAGTEVV
jgi:hypothetical protein